MLLGIDHIVVAVREPDRAAASLERDAGLAFTGGGRHEQAGTFNRLAFTGDAYIELIGVFDAALVRSTPAFAVGLAALAVLEAGAEGMATYALATDAIEADVAALRSGGSPIDAPVAGSRVRPDGAVVRWITAFPALGPDRPPFLIEHEADGPEWGAAAMAARATFRHPGGGRVRLAGVGLPSPDPVAAAERYRRTLGIELDASGGAVVGQHAIHVRAASRATGHPVIDLVGDPASAGLDLLRHGVRWRRIGAPT